MIKCARKIRGIETDESKKCQMVTYILLEEDTKNKGFETR